MEISFEKPQKSALAEKFERFIWLDMDQKNILNQAFSIIPDKLRVLRSASLMIHLGVLIWVIYASPSFMLENIWELGAQVGTWGLLLNTSYIILTFAFNQAGPYNLSWKMTYILGECAAAFGFFVTFFFVYLLPEVLVDHGGELDIFSLVLQFSLHALCPLMIWLDMFYNYYTFPKRHIKCALFVTGAYLLNNYIWTQHAGHPVYPVLDWTGLESAIVTVVSLSVVLFGYLCGNMQYRWKMKRETQNIVLTLQMNEVSSPNKLSQYHPINFDF